MNQPHAGKEEKTVAVEPDLPAESIQVLIGDEFDWTDINPVYDRDDSTKGNTNPKAQHNSHGVPKSSTSRSNSQRFSGNLKPNTPIIALAPAKIQHSGYLGRSSRRPTANRIFPKKGAAAPREGKATAVTAEPGSPKVSCIGKVLSDRERNRSRRVHEEKNATQQQEKEKKRGLWSGLALQCCGGGIERRRAVVECVEEDSPKQPAGGAPEPPRYAAEKVAVEPVGLGAMKRFSSGRRPSLWEDDGDAEGHVACSGLLYQGGHRRSVGSLEDAQRRVDWESEGSSSV